MYVHVHVEGMGACLGIHGSGYGHVNFVHDIKFVDTDVHHLQVCGRKFE